MPAVRSQTGSYRSSFATEMQGFLVSVDYAGAMNYFTLPLYLKFECKIVFLYIVKREDFFCYLCGEGCLLIVKMSYYGVLKIINKNNNSFL